MCDDLSMVHGRENGEDQGHYCSGGNETSGTGKGCH